MELRSSDGGDQAQQSGGSTDADTWVVMDTIPLGSDVQETLPFDPSNGLPAHVGVLLQSEGPAASAEETPEVVTSQEKTSMEGVPTNVYEDHVVSHDDVSMSPPKLDPEVSAATKAGCK